MDNIVKDIVDSFGQCEKADFDRLFHLFHRKIFLFCRHYHLSAEEAEEIVQEVFLKVWLNRKSLDASRNIQSYIYTIAKNLIFNHFKRKICQKAAYEHYLSQGDHYQLEQDIICDDLNRIIEKAINDLPQKRKEIFNLSRKGDLSNKEIAEKLYISIKTVESQMRLSLQYLRQELKRHTDFIMPALVLFNTFFF